MKNKTKRKAPQRGALLKMAGATGALSCEELPLLGTEKKNPRPQGKTGGILLGLFKSLHLKINLD